MAVLSIKTQERDPYETQQQGHSQTASDRVGNGIPRKWDCEEEGRSGPTFTKENRLSYLKRANKARMSFVAHTYRIYCWYDEFQVIKRHYIVKASRMSTSIGFPPL